MKERRYQAILEGLRKDLASNWVLGGSVFNMFPSNLDKAVYKTYVKIQRSELFSTEEVYLVVQALWVKATLKELQNALQVLELEGALKESSPGKWKNLRLKETPQITKATLQNWGDYRSPKTGEKNKPGKCTICGEMVTYKNRHSRSGSSHTGEQCNLNRIRSVMET